MEEKEDKKNVILLGEIWSLVGLILVMLFILNYLSEDQVTLEGRGGDQVVGEQVSETQGLIEKGKQYIVKNRPAVIISTYIVIIILLMSVLINIVIWHYKKKEFAKQNAISRQKVLEYQKKFRKEQ